MWFVKNKSVQEKQRLFTVELLYILLKSFQKRINSNLYTYHNYDSNCLHFTEDTNIYLLKLELKK